jgi:hypothetical protein
MSEIGDRVGVIEKANRETVWLIGYGVYEGDTVPPNTVGGSNMGFPSPTIKLDIGGIMYACECLWGSEDKVREMVGDRKVIMVALEAR